MATFADSHDGFGSGFRVDVFVKPEVADWTSMLADSPTNSCCAARLRKQLLMRDVSLRLDADDVSLCPVAWFKIP